MFPLFTIIELTPFGGENTYVLLAKVTVPFPSVTTGTVVNTPPFCIPPFSPAFNVPAPNIVNNASLNTHNFCTHPEVCPFIATVCTRIV